MITRAYDLPPEMVRPLLPEIAQSIIDRGIEVMTIVGREDDRLIVSTDPRATYVARAIVLVSDLFAVEYFAGDAQADLMANRIALPDGRACYAFVVRDGER